MIKIYKYPKNVHNTEEWENVLNSNISYKEKEKLFNEISIKYGKEVTIQEYFSDYSRSSWIKDYNYIMVGEPSNVIEKLVSSEIGDYLLNYCYMKDRSSEDLIESRTSWDELASYADEMYYFIDEIKSEIANGTIIISNKEEK